MSLGGRTAIVTGAASGLGRATAVALAAEGARVVVAGLQPDELERTVALIVEGGGEAVAVHVDVGDERAVARMADTARERFGGTDILVNNSATYPIGPWHEAEPEQWDRVLRVNTTGYFMCARAVREQMLERGGGAIVNIASVTFYEGTALLLSYVASKGAVIGFTRALAREVGEFGITVNAVAPGMTASDTRLGPPPAITSRHARADVRSTVFKFQRISSVR